MNTTHRTGLLAPSPWILGAYAMLDAPESRAVIDDFKGQALEGEGAPTFSAEYKRAVLAEIDRGGPASVAGILRREGLYYGHVLRWREEAARGAHPRSLPPERVEDRPGASSARNELREALYELRTNLSRIEVLLERSRARASWAPPDSSASRIASVAEF